MIRKGLVVSLALCAGAAGCAVNPATGMQAAAPGRTIAAAPGSATVQIPTAVQMRQLVPSRLSREEGRRLLTIVPKDKILLPAPQRKTQMIVGTTFGLGLGGLGLVSWQTGILTAPLAGIAGFYPFAYSGFNYYAPFLWNPLALAYDAFALSPWLTSAIPYFESPFIGGYGWGLGTLAYGSLGCGLAPATLIATTAIGGCF